MNSTLYEKIGRRYWPVQDTRAYEGLTNGCWLVKVEGGTTHIRESVDPENAAIEFACMANADSIVKVLRKASEARMVHCPKGRPLTKREIRAIKAYNDVMGCKPVLLFEYNSLQGIAEEIVKELVRENMGVDI